MKKIYLAVFLACSMGGAVHAQISEGGLPWTMSLKNEGIRQQAVSTATFAKPDYAQYLKEDDADAKAGVAKPYRVAPTLSSDISMNSGTWSYLDNGSRIWRMKVNVPGALAMGFNYDKFRLPEGVHFYVKNENGRQLLGAYSTINNNKEDMFAHQEVQGETVFLEMDIAAGVAVSDIKFHINKVYPYYRGAGLVTELYADASGSGDTQLKPTDAQSPCHINANCPDGDGVPFGKAKAATVQINMGGAVCSGTMINSTGNATGGACKPYLLTASHCSDNNGRTDADFINWVFTFNYQYTTCAGGTLATTQTRTGANFRARSNLPSIPNSGNAYVADFLLLELLGAPPVSGNIYYAGWNRDANIFDNPDYYNKFIGFHHPGGDRKKLSVSLGVDPSGTFNQNSVPNTHWSVQAVVGGTEGGSSGSGLFDIDGLLVGDLSGGPASTGACAPMGYSALYCKLSYAWENAFDQTNFPAYAGAQSRLKDWLDPINSGRLKLPATKSDCSDYNQVGVNEVAQLNSSIDFYPNPSTGIVNTRVNFASPTSFTVTVFDVLGKKQTAYDVSNAMSGTYQMDLSSLPNGIYMLNINSGKTTISKKIIIAK